MVGEGETYNVKEKRLHSSSGESSDEFKPKLKKSCKNGERVKVHLESKLDSSADSTDLKLTYGDCHEEADTNQTSVNEIDEESFANKARQDSKFEAKDEEDDNKDLKTPANMNTSEKSSHDLDNSPEDSDSDESVPLSKLNKISSSVKSGVKQIKRGDFKPDVPDVRKTNQKSADGSKRQTSVDKLDKTDSSSVTSPEATPKKKPVRKNKKSQKGKPALISESDSDPELSSTDSKKKKRFGTFTSKKNKNETLTTKTKPHQSDSISDSGSNTDADSAQSKKSARKIKKRQRDDSDSSSDSGPFSDFENSSAALKDTKKTVGTKDKPEKSDSSSDSGPDSDTNPVSRKRKDDSDPTTDSDSDANSNKKAKAKTATMKQAKKKTDTVQNNSDEADSTSDSDSETRHSDEDSKKKIKAKTTTVQNKSDESDSTSDSGPDPDLDSEPENFKKGKESKDAKNKENKESKIKKSKGGSKDSADPHQLPQIIRLKKYIHAAGIYFCKYDKLWEGCKNNKERINRMLSLLNEKGIVGRPSLKKCKKFKQAKETEKEIAELSKNIILNPNGRSLRVRSNPGNSNNASNAEPSSEMKKVFQRIKAVFDSDSE